MSENENVDEDVRKIIEELDMNSDAVKEGAIEADADSFKQLLSQLGIDPSSVGNKMSVIAIVQVFQEHAVSQIQMFKFMANKLKSFATMCDGELAEHIDEASEHIEKYAKEDGAERLGDANDALMKAIEEADLPE